MQQCQEQVLLVHLRHVHDAGLEYRQAQHIAGLLVEYEVVGVDGFLYVVIAYALLQGVLDGLRVQLETLEDVGYGAVLHAHQPEQQMLRCYRTAGQTCCLLA